ncbi:amidohydrolase family protein [Amaricoccus solimangrovi]|nr:amidohydrolase family protein [Amaricoccus solimangrovi]
MAARLIDVHPHIISKDTAKYPIDPIQGRRSPWSASRPRSFEELVAEMDDAGVDKACIVHSSTTYGTDPSYLADVIEANPGRFTGCFSMDVLAPDAEVVFRRWVGRGLTGIRLYTAGAHFDAQTSQLSDPRSFPVWEAAIELGVTITTQLRPEGLPQLLEMLSRFPEATVLVDNTLKPNYQEGPPYHGSEHVFMLERYPNVHLKVITNGIRASYEGAGRPETFYPRLVSVFGAERLAWGSNFPASVGTLAEHIAEARAALSCLGEPDQDWIFAKTAERLYPVLAERVEARGVAVT